MTKRSDQPSDDPALGSFDPALHPPQDFSDEDWAWFAERSAALGIDGVEPLRGRFAALFGHLVGVNRWLNLTTITAPREFLKLHVLDSLALVGDARLRHLAAGAPCVDLGSGGGYPGLPLAAWFSTVPWVLADTRRKKADFLAVAGTLTGNPACTGRHLRGSEVKHAAPELWRKCQLVTCRAMGQAEEVLREAADLVRPHGHVVIYKGPAFPGDERELALSVGGKLGYRLVAERRVRLVAEDPERIMAVFQRER